MNRSNFHIFVPTINTAILVYPLSTSHKNLTFSSYLWNHPIDIQWKMQFDHTSSSSMSFRSSSASGTFNKGLSLFGNMYSQTVGSPRSKLKPYNTKQNCILLSLNLSENGWCFRVPDKIPITFAQLTLTPNFCSTNLDPFRTVLHVDPVVDVVPRRLNSQVVTAIHWVGKSSKWLNEKVLWYLPLTRQN